MKKTVLFFSFIGCIFLLFSQNQICVDGSSTATESGTPSNPYKTIQKAINNAANGDLIKVAKGTYSEAVQITEKKVELIGGYAGSGNFDASDPQTNVTIISGTSAAPCIKVRIVDAAISGTLKIRGFTIRNGQRGIELDNDGWSENLNNIVIGYNIIENNGLENTLQHGGGIGLTGKNVTIQYNVIRNNKSGRGAAISSWNTPPDNFLIVSNRIENNTGYDDHAGGINIVGKGTIIGNTFVGNVAAKNYTYGWGGAIVIFCPSETVDTDVTLSFNTYYNNYAPSRGGAVFVDDRAIVRMEHELLYNNKTTSGSGSAIYVDADWIPNPSVLYMNNCTVYGNTTNAYNGAALFVQGSKVEIENCIFWNNGFDFEKVDEGSLQATLSVKYSLTEKGFTGTGNISADPLFADASKGDFHLLSAGGRYNPATGQFVKDNVTSPAIDAGNPASVFSNEPMPNGGRVNLGCYGNTAEASKTPEGRIDDNTQTSWKVFPNPAKESITISDLPIGSRLDVFDITGKKVYSSDINNEQFTLSTVNFENGVYFVEITHNGAVSNRKIVVNK